jgi:predicted amidophosphoribosyltransferase
MSATLTNVFIAPCEIAYDMLNFCTNCGKKLSFLQRHADGTLCSYVAKPSQIRAKRSWPLHASDLKSRGPEQ